VQALREARERTLAIMASASEEEIFATTRIARDLWL
jgi:hypothetical protein